MRPRTVIVIPARLAALRLPNKPLAVLGGLPLVVRVAQQAQKCPDTDAVLVAADDPLIIDAVTSHGIDAVLTDPTHTTGTDRVAEVARDLAVEIVINLQADEPFIDPRDLRALIDELATGPGEIATLRRPIADSQELRDPNVVKVVCDDRGRALDFSRAPIPFDALDHGNGDGAGVAFAHLGVYAYRKQALIRVAAAPVHPREVSERLEQLRALALGIDIRVCVAQTATRGIDTHEDLEWAQERVSRLGESAFPNYV